MVSHIVSCDIKEYLKKWYKKKVGSSKLPILGKKR
jgi:hypothetical protein